MTDIEKKEKFVMSQFKISMAKLWGKSAPREVSDARKVFYVLNENETQQYICKWLEHNRKFVTSQQMISFHQKNVSSVPLLEMVCQIYDKRYNPKPNKKVKSKVSR